MDFKAFLSTLPYMLKGMVSIFVITLVIVLCIFILNKLTTSRKKDDSDTI